MSAVNSVLQSIITGKKDFCCLCLNANVEETLSIEDEITVNLNDNVHHMDIAAVVCSVLGEETFSYINTVNTLCKQCVKSAITCYRFIQISQKNLEYLTSILDSVANSFAYTTDELYDSKSLYVSLNLNDFSSKHYYDMKKKVNTPQAALQRFCSLDNTEKLKTEEAAEIKKETKTPDKVKRRRRTFADIPTSEMLCDKNNPDLIKCKECHNEYPRIWNLRQHYIKAHAPKVYKCLQCPKKYGSGSNLHTHIAESHSNLVCSECGKIFNNRSTLKMHELGHHMTVVCPDCGRVYKSKNTFKKHIELNVCGREVRAHPSEAKFTCDYCNKKYTQKVSLRVHIQYEHGNYKSHICEWCGKKFWAPSRLKAHIVKHTREKNFTCSICGGKFVTKESLLYHTRTHTGEKPYKCQFCDSRFLSASRRSVHMKSHHHGATHECDICHSKFSSRMILQKHKRSHVKSEESSNSTTSLLDNKNQNNDVFKTNSKVEVQELWKMNEASLQTILESSGVEIHHFKHIQLEDKIYLEVSDDAEEYII